MSEASSPIRSIFNASPVLPMILEFHRVTILTEIKSFKDYIIENHNSMSERQTAFNDMIEEKVKSYPDNEQEVYEWFEDDLYQYNEFYPTMFNNSTLLSIYSFFEFSLKNLCTSLSKYWQYKIQLDDLDGRNYIEKSKKYLILIANLDLTDIDSIWQEITKFQKIRNNIVHNNSNIIRQKDKPLEKQLLYPIVNSNRYLKLNIEKGTFIIENNQFLLDMLDLIEKYLTSIIGKFDINK